MKEPKGMIYDENHKPRRSIVGQQFNYIKIIKVAGYTLEQIDKENNRNGKKRTVYECQCSCGNIFKARGKDIESDKIKSCGCYHQITSSITGSKNTKERGLSGINVAYNSYKKSAEVRNYVFEISKEDFRKLTLQNCFYCNTEAKLTPPSQSGYSQNGRTLFNGLDRIDNSKGYTLLNVVTCCKECNYSKNRRNFDPFINHIERIYLNLVEKGLLNPQVSI